MGNKRIGVLLFLSVLLGSPLSAQAANKALLIGTTSYANKVYNLPGIELDIAEMSRVARKLGFAESNIKTLTGKEVTLENIEAQFKGFLRQGVTKNDTLLIYYSGHGVQMPDKNGDESDSEDEALTLYDLEGSYDADRNLNWDGVLLDDRMSQLLGSLASANVFVVVDACHSGTVTRSYTGTAVVDTKAYGTDVFAVKSLGAPRIASRSLGGADSLIDDIDSGVVTLSAAQDHQLSLASSKGSLFTLALSESLEAQRGTASPQSLLKAATAILEQKLDDGRLFHPNLTGDKSLFSKAIVLTESQDREEVNQVDLLELVREGDALPIALSKTTFFKNELIELTVDIPADGYLNILAVDSNDEMVVLFPNGLDKNNQVSAGRLSLPGKRPFEWAAQAPWGTTMITALFSRTPFNLFDTSLQRSENGTAMADYVLPSLAALESYRRDSGLRAAGSIFLKTCSNSASTECQ